MLASHFNLNNITVCIDYNNLQSLTTVDDTISLQPLTNKLQAFGWHVSTIDGHSHPDIKNALNQAKQSHKPGAIILETIKGKGVSFMENQVAWHYKSPNDIELAQALDEVGKP